MKIKGKNILALKIKQNEKTKKKKKKGNNLIVLRFVQSKQDEEKSVINFNVRFCTTDTKRN